MKDWGLYSRQKPGTIGDMRKPARVHVAKIPRTINGKTYVSYLLRHTYRDGGKVRRQNYANIPSLPLEGIQGIDAMLRGRPLIDALDAFPIQRWLPPGRGLRPRLPRCGQPLHHGQYTGNGRSHGP